MFVLKNGGQFIACPVVIYFIMSVKCHNYISSLVHDYLFYFCGLVYSLLWFLLSDLNWVVVGKLLLLLLYVVFEFWSCGIILQQTIQHYKLVYVTLRSIFWYFSIIKDYIGRP